MKVSIIIPNYNGKDLLQKNLPQVLKAAPKAEVIVVDDASTDDSHEYLSKYYTQVKIIKHPKNLRFAAACNSGAKAASGDILILLNSDVVPQIDFLPPLIKHFKDNNVFSVGSLEIEVNNGKKIISGRTEGDFQRGFLIHWRPTDQESQSTLWNFGGSMAVDRKKYLKLGGMDSLYSPAYWEDIDLCWRAAQKGWKIIFEKDSVVYHHHESTNQTVFGKKKMQEIAFRNQILFVWKNIRGEKLIKHFLWLPYHLIFTSIKTKGLFLKAFLNAIIRFTSYKNQKI
jgi:GT2 family glycosyltransferase